MVPDAGRPHASPSRCPFALRLSKEPALSLSKEPALSLSKEPALSLSKGGRGRHGLVTLLLILSCGGGSSSGGGGGGGTIWSPSSAAPLAIHWQLSGDLDPALDLPLLTHRTVFDLDGELTSAGTVAALHAMGTDVKVICYFDAGAYEPYRSDAASLEAHPELLGKAMDGWPDERWLDIRRLDLLVPIMRQRMVDWCQAKGFDGVEGDDTEVSGNDSGFPITQADNDAYNRALAAAAHALGLSIGLKNNNARAAALADAFDWALSEQCWEYDECDGFKTGFADQGKAVFTVDYDAEPDCTTASAWHLNSLRRDLDLVGPRDEGYLYQPCLADTATAW